jgi:hypothetical protein
MQNESIYCRMTEAEKEVAMVLKKFGIQWSYEQPLFVWDENKRPRVWTPDFYLVHLGIYLEVCGSEKFDYEYRRKIFDRNGYLVIFLHVYKEKDKWIHHLMSSMKFFSKYRIRNVNEIFSRNIVGF